MKVSLERVVGSTVAEVRLRQLQFEVWTNSLIILKMQRYGINYKGNINCAVLIPKILIFETKSLRKKYQESERSKLQKQSVDIKTSWEWHEILCTDRQDYIENVNKIINYARPWSSSDIMVFVAVTRVKDRTQWHLIFTALLSTPCILARIVYSRMQARSR